VKLFGHDTSPYVRRIRVLLAELQLPFERDTHGWQDPSDDFLAASPIGRLPVLDRGAGAPVRFLYDSRVIAEALYALPHPTPGGTPPFQDSLWRPELDGRDRNVVSVSDGALDALVNVFCLEQDGIRTAQSPYLRRQEQRARDCLDWLERIYAGRTTLDGRLAFVDVSVLCALGWIRFRNRMDLAPWPALGALEAAHRERPSLVSTRPPT
jgi:glutathione S-transferase